MANILVTGGAGFIGSHTCKALKSAGHNPITLDNLSRGNKGAIRWGPFVECDIRDFDRVTQAIRDHRIDAVLHFAAFAYISESVKKPTLYFENNVEGSLLLFEAMKQEGLTKIVFSSSCATYGESNLESIDEFHLQKPITPYGLTKLMVEKILLSYQKLFNFDFCALRYFNAAGADPDGEIGEDHDPEPHIIPTFIKRAANKEQLIINGNDFKTADGTCVRDFIHVTDLAQSHVEVLNSLLKEKKISPFYNIGTGKGFSLLEIATEINSIFNNSTPVAFTQRRPGDPAKLVGNSQLFQKDFNWSPQLSTLPAMIETAGNWLLHKKKTAD